MTSYDASTDPQLTLLGAVLAHLLEHARRHDVDVLLVGAAARDVLIRHATGALPSAGFATRADRWFDRARRRVDDGRHWGHDGGI